MKDERLPLLSIYGANFSKDEKKLVITLVAGSDDNKQYYHACVKLDNSQKTKVNGICEGSAMITIPLLLPKQENANKEVSDDDLPF
jgi:hypothetical protein